MAEVKIWPRGQNETGGILLMPMKKNIPKGHGSARKREQSVRHGVQRTTNCVTMTQATTPD